MAKIKEVSASGNIMEVRLDTDTEAISEKIFMQTPGASMQHLDLGKKSGCEALPNSFLITNREVSHEKNSGIFGEYLFS